MKEEMDKGHYCYVVYPLIEESDKMDLKDAKSVDAQVNYPDDLEANLWLDSRFKGTSIGSGDL